MKYVLMALAGAAIIGTGGYNAHAAQQKALRPTNVRTGASSITAVDEKFAREAAMGNIAEVKLGKLAQQRGQSAFVKNFGAMMVADHTKANNTLERIASDLRIELPNDTDAKHKAIYARLSKMEGRAFDAAYRKVQIQDHQATYVKYRQFANKGNNYQLQDYARKGAPIVKMHLDSLRTGKMTAHKPATAHRP